MVGPASASIAKQKTGLATICSLRRGDIFVSVYLKMIKSVR